MNSFLKRASVFVLLGLSVFNSRVLAQSATLRPGDIFEMRMTGVPDPSIYATPFQGMFTIGDDGMVGIPLLKEPVKGAGLTADGLAKVIDDRLIAEKIFAHPLAVISMSAQNRSVTLGGAGMRQGIAIPWTTDLTLRSAINRAGGFSEYANKKKIKVTRGGQTKLFNLTKAETDPSQNPKVFPGDEVEVTE